ncbi:VIT family protein [Sphingomonas changnyeongensis]|uniref:VIT family protein n=1 Tax=Sphingomonas changnyeongensis TaxID=2698679 RepID=A0A7Z2S5D7_9SPHN|nr:VIT family protein [Sphingomonas changnyeongensis]QHL91005.1 VIT family protein [Sphingomonas changnyeongensis]
MPMHDEAHLVARIGWLRAAVLGANDGIVSTASLILGVAASGADRQALLVAGVAGLVAGAMSMAAGEYVSVSSQADTEAADLGRERAELAASPALELQELAAIYRARGVDAETADRVARQMTAHDALAAHARDELNITDTMAARPVVAALASAGTFTAGAALPLMLVLMLPMAWMMAGQAAGSILFLALLGAVGARAGGAAMGRPVARVVFWGALAMALTAGIGRLAGTAV